MKNSIARDPFNGFDRCFVHENYRFGDNRLNLLNQIFI